jgi:hypothetical protein
MGAIRAELRRAVEWTASFVGIMVAFIVTSAAWDGLGAADAWTRGTIEVTARLLVLGAIALAVIASTLYGLVWLLGRAWRNGANPRTITVVAIRGQQ